MHKATLSQINIYPVKSISGVQLASAQVEEAGIGFDRRFLVAFPDGGMLTARKYPKLLKVSSKIREENVELFYPKLSSLRLSYSDFHMGSTNAVVWKDQFHAYKTTVEADQWFSQIVGESVQLLYLGEESNRIGVQSGVKISFADGYPLLVISEGSLDELNALSPVQHTMSQFRTNLVISGVEAFAEDGWQRFRIGGVEFEVREPCSRCILTTIDPETTERKPLKEPLATLATFRKGVNGKVYFGQNLVPLNEGIIHQGDVIEVLAEKQPELYRDNRKRVQ